jgi:hypothetical protein
MVKVKAEIPKSPPEIISTTNPAVNPIICPGTGPKRKAARLTVINKKSGLTPHKAKWTERGEDCKKIKKAIRRIKSRYLFT